MRFALVAVSAAALATLAGCSEPVPPSPDGAFFLATTQPDPLACHIAGHTAQVGAIDAQERTSVVTDGTKMTAVSCTVLNMAAPFAVHGKIDDQVNSANYLEIDIPSISPSNKKDSPAPGTVNFSAAWTAGEPYGGQCNFYFENTKETVDVGRIWVSFDCPGLNSGMSTCPLKQGYAIFENCLTDDLSGS